MHSTSRSLRLQPVGPPPDGGGPQLDDPVGRGGGGCPEAKVDPPATRSRRLGLLAVGLVALLLAAGVLGRELWPSPEKGVDIRAGTTAVTAKAMAARYGIDVTLIGVSAAGGLVDFRYQVVDPDKANPIIHDIDLFPKLVEENTGATLVMRSLPHNHKKELEFGGSYFFLLPNANNALHEGSRVTLVIGDARLEHIRVRG